MSADYKFTNETGVISVDTSELLSDVIGEWKEALGDGLVTDASTPQGTLIQDETLARTSVMKNNAELANVVNPSYSYGTFLDALAALTGVERGHNTTTVVKEVIFEGNTGVTIPAGSRVKTSNGDLFATVSAITLVTGTKVRGVLQSIEYGEVPMDYSADLIIVDGVIGWGAVRTDTNTTAVAGATQLNDAALKVARKRGLYRQGVGSLGSIYGRLSAVDGVTSLMAIENATGAAGTVNGITFTTPNGVWVCVGGTASDTDIANALWLAHMGGQPWDYGATNQGINVQPTNGVRVIDSNSGMPYYIKFTRPVMYDAYVNITVKQGTSIANQDDIKEAILNYAYGKMNGEEGFTVGSSVSAFELGAAVGYSFPGLYVKKVAVAAVAAGSAAPTVFGDEWVANPWDQAQINIGYINVSFV